MLAENQKPPGVAGGRILQSGLHDKLTCFFALVNTFSVASERKCSCLRNGNDVGRSAQPRTCPSLPRSNSAQHTAAFLARVCLSRGVLAWQGAAGGSAGMCCPSSQTQRAQPAAELPVGRGVWLRAPGSALARVPPQTPPQPAGSSSASADLQGVLLPLAVMVNKRCRLD